MATTQTATPLVITDRWTSALEPRRETPPSMRIFGLIMLGGCGLLGGLLLWNGLRTGDGGRITVGGSVVAIGIVIAVWALLWPSTIGPVYRGWMRFGLALGTIVSTVLLTVFYYLILTPIGQLMRLTGTDPLDRQLDPGRATYWKAHAPSPNPDDYVHMS